MTKTDFQGLLDIVKIAEKTPIIDMSQWSQDTACGTVGCLIGTYIKNNPNQAFHLHPYLRLPSIGFHSGEHAIAFRFGITVNEACWLFVHNPLAFREEEKESQYPRTLDAHDLVQEQAIARLRKFIYYKLHKAEYEETVYNTTDSKTRTQLLNQNIEVNI